MDEFALIRRYFAAAKPVDSSVILGIGDDAALLTPAPGKQLVACTDTLVEGRHFLPDADPSDLGWKALAINLSDLAAMGAQPRWCLLALTLPEADADWLRGFSAGLQACAEQFGVALVGGDTTRGPLTITITALGEVAPGEALRRDAAQPGDLIAVTGPLGDGAAGLAVMRDDAMTRQLAPEHSHFLRLRYARPTPRLAQGMALAGLAHAAIDISDGLLQDLSHVLAASGVGAAINVASVPASPALQAVPDAERRRQWQLAGGDDYELVVTFPPDRLTDANAKLAEVSVSDLQIIGEIRAEPGLVDAQSSTTLSAQGFSHF